MRHNFHAHRGTIISAANFEEWLLSTQSRRGKMAYRAYETDLVDGRWLWMTEAVQSDGWMLCIANDITSLRADSRKVRQDRDFAIKASHTDELTGVANRRYVLARIEETIRNVSRSKETSGCLAILDIDKFKQINDRYGHSVGDLILRDFAHTIHRLVRRRDCLGRIGGEEFLVLLPDTQIENAQLIVGRMLSQTSMSRPLQGAPDFSYTFSAGIAGVRSDDTVETLYGRADRALYSAKGAGRNCIHLESDQIDQPAASA
jgi:diguanylate cyclase (GGDEF)-like protein